MNINSDDTDRMLLEAVTASTAYALREDWVGAVNCIEEALARTRPEIVELMHGTLFILYAKANQYEKLFALVNASKTLSPVVVIGCLTAYRNRMLGVGGGGSVKYTLAETIEKLGLYIDQDVFTLDELYVLCSLSTQLRYASLSLKIINIILNKNLPYKPYVDEEMTSAVLALGLHENCVHEVTELIGRLENLSTVWKKRADRYRVLVGERGIECLPGNDKVSDFLRAHPNLLMSS
jgi:hypothetical protein